MKLFHEELKGWPQGQQGQKGNLHESVTVPQRQTHVTSVLLPVTRDDSASLHHCRAESGQVTHAYPPVGVGERSQNFGLLGQEPPLSGVPCCLGHCRQVGSLRPTGYLAVWEGVLGVDGQAAGCSKYT